MSGICISKCISEAGGGRGGERGGGGEGDSSLMQSAMLADQEMAGLNMKDCVYITYG